MKRCLTIVLAVLVLLSVCGCSAAGTKAKITRKTGNAAPSVPNKDKKGKAWDINEARGHFVDEGAKAQMSGEGPVAAVTEAYFTNNGHLCIELLISNGMAQVISIDALDVVAYDYATEALIGGGKAELEEPLTISAAGTESYTFYIAPEHIQIGEKESVPELMSFDVTMDYHAIEVE